MNLLVPPAGRVSLIWFNVVVNPKSKSIQQLLAVLQCHMVAGEVSSTFDAQLMGEPGQSRPDDHRMVFELEDAVEATGVFHVTVTDISPLKNATSFMDPAIPDNNVQTRFAALGSGSDDFEPFSIPSQ